MVEDHVQSFPYPFTRSRSGGTVSSSLLKGHEKTTGHRLLGPLKTGNPQRGHRKVKSLIPLGQPSIATNVNPILISPSLGFVGDLTIGGEHPPLP